MADTLTAFETQKSNPSGLTPGADPNRKALDGLTASEIKKAAGLMCKTLPREISNKNKESCFRARQERNSPLIKADCWR